MLLVASIKFWKLDGLGDSFSHEFGCEQLTYHLNSTLLLPETIW